MASDMFLVFKGPGSAGVKIEGETNDDEMKKEKAIELQSFSVGVTNTLMPGSGSGGLGAGKCDWQGCNASKSADTSTTALFLNCANGGHFDDVYVLLRRAGTDPTKTGGDYLKFSFKMVALDSVILNDAMGGQAAQESFSWQYGAIQVEYWWQDATGKSEGPVMMEWSRILNIRSFAVK